MIKQAKDKIINFLVLNTISIYGKIRKKYYLKQSNNASEISKKLLFKLLDINNNTDIGKKYNFKDIRTIEDFQKQVPFTTYDDYTDYINIMVNKGIQNLITSKKINYFAHTSGTMGITKMIPVSDDVYDIYLDCAAIFMYNLKKEYKEKRKGLICGRGLNMIETEYEVTPGGIKSGYISGYAISNAKHIMSAISCIPKEVLSCGEEIDMKYIKARYALQDRNLIYMMTVFMSSITDLLKYIEDNHEMLIKDIETGTINKSIKIPDHIRMTLEKKIKPDKKRAKELYDIFTSNKENELVPKIWKKMTLIVGICTGEFSPFEKKMRKYCGNDITFCYNMYASSESLIASTMENSDKNYLLLPNSGFYEFISIDNNKTLLMNELEIGKLYEIVVTNLCGLYRYKIKDVVKVTGYYNEIPLLQFAYRKEQGINMGGVHLTIDSISTAIKQFEESTNIDILDYSLYVNNDHVPARIELFIEPENDISIDVIKNISSKFDEALIQVNKEYERMLKIDECDNSVVHCVEKGTYNKYRDLRIENGTIVNQIKTIRFITKKQDLEFLLKYTKK